MIAGLWTWGQLLEGGMLVCFGLSWPVDILKTLRTRRTEGKSLGFMTLILAGYLLGFAAKLFRAAQGGQAPEAVIILYVLNAVLILVDIALTLRYRPRADIAEPAADAEKAP